MSIKTRTSGIMVNINVEPAAAAYTGPLDRFGTSSGAWGMRALSAAMLGQNIVRIVSIDGVTFPEENFIAMADTGLVDTVSIATFLGANEGRILKFYDQSGGTNHMTASSRNNAPTYSSSPVAADHRTGISDNDSDAAITLTQPFALSAVAAQGDTAGVFLYWTSADAARFAVRVGSYTFIDTNAAEVPRNTTITGGGTWFAAQALFNGASSKLLINGIAATTDGDTGAGNVNSVNFFAQGWHSVSGINPSYARELILWDADPGDAIRTSIEANQRTFWGF